MRERIYDEENGLWYEKQGDYYLPCLELTPEEPCHIGVWGHRHLQYIKKHRKIRYTTLLLSGKLCIYLATIDKQAENMFFQVVRAYAEYKGTTEELKEEDQMEWVARMNYIRNLVTDLVNDELIYT